MIRNTKISHDGVLLIKYLTAFRINCNQAYQLNGISINKLAYKCSSGMITSPQLVSFLQPSTHDCRFSYIRI